MIEIRPEHTPAPDRFNDREGSALRAFIVADAPKNFGSHVTTEAAVALITAGGDDPQRGSLVGVDAGYAAQRLRVAGAYLIALAGRLA